jgi:hypothetical protein
MPTKPAQPRSNAFYFQHVLALTAGRRSHPFRNVDLLNRVCSGSRTSEDRRHIGLRINAFLQYYRSLGIFERVNRGTWKMVRPGTPHRPHQSPQQRKRVPAGFHPLLRRQAIIGILGDSSGCRRATQWVIPDPASPEQIVGLIHSHAPILRENLLRSRQVNCFAQIKRRLRPVSIRPRAPGIARSMEERLNRRLAGEQLTAMVQRIKNTDFIRVIVAPQPLSQTASVGVVRTSTRTSIRDEIISTLKKSRKDLTSLEIINRITPQLKSYCPSYIATQARIILHRYGNGKTPASARIFEYTDGDTRFTGTYQLRKPRGRLRVKI